LKSDPAQKTNVLGQFPAIAQQFQKAYENWWRETLPYLVNENVPAPKVNPFKALYWKQFGGGPDEKLRRQMDP
jgi:hypothetical protein